LSGQARRDIVAAIVALALGGAIARIDASPGWDDTGITVGLLVVAAALAAAISGRRPWLWALLVALPTPLVEITSNGALASMVAIVPAALGAVGGYVLARAVESERQAGRPGT
jgi:hypothetical protein